MTVLTAILPRSQSCFAYNRLPNQNYYWNNVTGAINYGTFFDYRSYLKFDMSAISFLPSSKLISAKLWLYIDVDQLVVATPILFHEVTSAWDMYVVT